MSAVSRTGKRAFLAGLLAVQLGFSVSGCDPYRRLGATAYVPGALCLIDLATAKADFTSNQVPVEISSIDSDVAVVPVVEGATAIVEDGWNYSLERVISSGNMYLAKTLDQGVSEDEDSSEGAGDDSDDAEEGAITVLLPPLYESEISDLLEVFGLEEDQLVVATDVRSVEESLVTGLYNDVDVDYVALSQPYLEIAARGEEIVSEAAYNLTDEYTFTYGVFVKSTEEDEKIIDNVIDDIEDAIIDIGSRGANQTLKKLLQIGDTNAIDYFGADHDTYQEIQLIATDSGYDVANGLAYLQENPTVEELTELLGFDANLVLGQYY